MLEVLVMVFVVGVALILLAAEGAPEEPAQLTYNDATKALSDAFKGRKS